MVRKLALAVSLALGTLSVPVHALGLGELSSKSTLNQNFEGNITLLSVKADELDGVRVRLADNEAFTRAGIERPFYLTLLKFEPTLSSRGKSVVRVSSDFPIREPFLNFLIEVDWPNGRLLREYTVLLDPPTTTKRRPPKVKAAAKARQAAPTAKTSAAPVVSSDGSEYGPVRANDTAWSIAKKVRPGGVSMEQMMMALLDANQRAFIDGNINRLRKGQILRVPALSEIQELSRQQARQAYREQQDQWLARRNEKLQSEAASEAATESAADGEVGSGSGAADMNDQLRIATARPDGEGEAGAGDDDTLSTQASDIKSRLIVARENAETSRQEAETLRSQVDDLQVRLEDMQKLLSLKDDQLAQMQDRVVTEGLAEEESIASAEPEVVPQDAEAAGEAAAVQEELAATAETATVPDGEETQPATTTEYQIQDIAPQIDPDLIVLGGETEGAVPQAAGDAAAEEVLSQIDEEQGIGDIPPQIDPDLIVTGAVDAGPADEVIDVSEAPGVEAVVDEESAGAEIVIGEDATSDEIVVELEPPVEEGAVMDSIETAVSEPQPTEPVIAEPVTAPEVVADTTTETKTEPSESFIPKPLASILEKNMVPIGAGAAVLLGLFGWLSLRGRRKDEAAGVLQPELGVTAASAASAASPVSAADAVEIPSAVDAPALDPEALSDLPDSSFLDEFSPSEINTLQDETGEVDPVSEADVYIAYGRYQQAEEMLRQAMSRDPDRLALKHKLLEVHYATRNVDSFCVLAKEMVDAGQDSADESAWARAQDMGRELAPENALFALSEGEEGIDLTGVEVAAVAGAVVAADAAVDEDTLALDDLELSELTAEFDQEKSPAEDLEAPSEVSIMLDLEAPAEPELSEPELPEAIQLDDIAGLDFELPEADSGVRAESGDEENDTTADSMNLDSMLAQAEAAVDAEDSTLVADSEFSADELQAQLDELSDLSLLDSELDQPPQAATEEPPASLGLVEQDSGLSPVEGLDQPLNLDSAFDATAADEGAAETLELEAIDVPSEPAGEDEVATKLDLARAYVEMGDEDGARSILEEVVVEGNPTQRTDAEALLGQLG